MKMTDGARPGVIRGLGRAVLTIVLTTQLVLGGALPAQAGTFGTADYLAAAAPTAVTDRDARAERIRAFMTDARVSAQLEAFGIDPREARARVAGLSDTEIAQLDGRIGDLEAGSGVVGIIGAVFVVLLILELVGVTNVFTGF